MTSSLQDGRRASWLKERELGIGGSDAPTILGLNKFATLHDLYLDKVGEAKLREQHESAGWGHLLEPLVARRFSEETGLEILEQVDPEPLICDEHPFMRVTLDRWILAPEARTPISFLECKTRSSFADRYWEGGPPLDVLAQVQHQMIVTGFREGYVAVLLGGQKFRWFRVPWDQELATRLIDAERAFWQRVVDRDPPPHDVREVLWREDWGDLDPEAKVKVPEAEARLLLDRYKSLAAAEKGIKDQKLGIEAQFMEWIGPAGRAIAGKTKVAASWLPRRVRSFDLEAFRQDYPLLSEQYMTTQVIRELEVNPDKDKEQSE